MKWPWKEFEDRTATAIVNLKNMIEAKISKVIDAEHTVMMGQLNMFKKSEKIKHNRLEQRVSDLEHCLKGPLMKYRKSMRGEE